MQRAEHRTTWIHLKFWARLLNFVGLYRKYLGEVVFVRGVHTHSAGAGITTEQNVAEFTRWAGRDKCIPQMLKKLNKGQKPMNQVPPPRACFSSCTRQTIHTHKCFWILPPTPKPYVGHRKTSAARRRDANGGRCERWGGSSLETVMSSFLPYWRL